MPTRQELGCVHGLLGSNHKSSPHVSGILVFDLVPEAQESSGFYKWILTSLRFREEQI